MGLAMSNLFSMVDARELVQLNRAIAAMEIRILMQLDRAIAAMESRIAEVSDHIEHLKAIGMDSVRRSKP